ncbi:unnamed protein product, partial [marine sediment metagenome]
MPSVAEMKFRPSEFSFQVLLVDPASATPAQAVRCIQRFLRRKHAGLAEALDISAGPDEVIIRASGEAPQEMLHEAKELLCPDWERPPELEIEVDSEQFVIQIVEKPEEALLERQILRSRVRYFPYPVCEWFEISTGELLLTDRRITYEPEWTIMPEDDEAQTSGMHLIALTDIESCQRGDWWDIPCLMVEIHGKT